MIVDRRTGECVARPFDKFFNWGEGERTSSARVTSATEKMDGSLGILYRVNGKPLVATRGSFESEQASWATERLGRHDLSGLPADTTLLFEVIYPTNRIVVDYAGREELCLLAARNRHSGAFYERRIVEEMGEAFGFPVVSQVAMRTAAQALAALPQLSANSEGYVLEFADGQRFKFKGDEYKRVHRIVTGLTFSRVLDLVREGGVVEAREAIPDEFAAEFDEWVEEIHETTRSVVESVDRAFAAAPKSTRKDYALWCKAQVPELLPYMFARLDGQDVLPLALKHAFRGRS
ncbi:MAG: RNA ligase [Myxococcota bacterium]